MTNEQFINSIKNDDINECIPLHNGINLIVSRTDHPIYVTLVLDDHNDSISKVQRVRKALYRKVSWFCKQNHIVAQVHSDFHCVRVVIHSKKDWNRLGNLFQFLNGKKLGKTVRNNNPYYVR